MPTYDYRCQKTGEMFERWQSFGDKPLTTCILVHDDQSICGAPVKRVFSKVGISFKGEGFYKNDHGANARARASEQAVTKPSNNDKAKDSSSKESAANTSDSSSANGSKDTSPKSNTKSASTTAA